MLNMAEGVVRLGALADGDVGEALAAAALLLLGLGLLAAGVGVGDLAPHLSTHGLERQSVSGLASQQKARTSSAQGPRAGDE